ncbi:MAG: hypothetical protein LBM01_00505 [Christensenellaceae bacterium]|nr:hypothetical protein [Christensenellaceae bacterium]
MLNRIKILLKMQFANKEKRRKNKQKGKVNKFVDFVFALVVCGAVAFGLNFLLSLMQKLAFIPIVPALLPFVLVITQTVAIIATAFGLTKSLYNANDNAIVFSFPVNPNEVFISRLIFYYIEQLIAGLYFTIPLLIAFGLTFAFSSAFYIFALVLVFLLPLIAVLLGAILSLPIMYLKKLIIKFPVLKIALSVALIGLIIWVLAMIVGVLPNQINLVGFSKYFYDIFQKGIAWVGDHGSIYNVISAIMFSFERKGMGLFDVLPNSFDPATTFLPKLGVNITFVLLTVIALLAFTYIISIIYYNIASSSTEFSMRRNKAAKNAVGGNIFLTFLKRETIIKVRNLSHTFSSLSFLIAMPVAVWFISEILKRLPYSVAGVSLAISINVLIVLLMLMSSNTLSANAITSEGGEFNIVKTAPSQTWVMPLAKMFINFIFSFVSIIITSFILVEFTDFSVLQATLFAIIAVFLSTGHMAGSLQRDIINPHIADYALTGKDTSNPNIVKSMTSGAVLSIIFTGLLYFFWLESPSLALVKILIFALGYLIIRLYLVYKNMSVFYNRIEGV